LLSLASKRVQACNGEQRARLPLDDLIKRLAHTGLFWRSGAKAPVINAQQEPFVRLGMALSSTQELPATEWMKHVSYVDKIS
jgi:hypothetical protein